MALLFRLLARLPFPVLYGLAWIAHLLLYYGRLYRFRVVDENLARALPELSRAERRQIARQFYLNMARVALEVIKTQRMQLEDFRERMTLRNPELLEAATGGFTRPAIVLTMHQGNWEWMLHGATASLGVQIDPVYKPLHDQASDAFLLEVRSRFGSRPLPMDSAARDMLRRRGSFRLFVLVADQAPSGRERAYWTSFLGREAAFYLGAEVLAKLTRFPVLFARCHREGRGRYSIEFTQLGEPPYERDSHALTEAYIECVEAAIRDDPAGWLWSNRRWKRRRKDSKNPVDGNPAATGPDNDSA
jgi:KDO2-lipid IV(A) lauroyltransferase